MQNQEEKDNVSSNNRVNVVSSTVNAASNEVNDVGRKSSIKLPDDLNMLELEDISIFEDSNKDVFGAEAVLNNLVSTFQVSPILITRIYKDHHLQQIIVDLHSAPQTRRMSKNLEEHGLVSTVNQRKTIKTFKIVYFPAFIKNGTQKGYASFKYFMVYHLDVKSAFLYGKIEDEVYVCLPPRFKDLDFLDKFYEVEKALYELHQASRSWYETLSTYLLDNGFQRGKIDKTLFIKRHKGELTFFLGLQVKQKEDHIFMSQNKYVAEILKKFGFSKVKKASTLMETQKPLLKDKDREEVYVHIYRSMIGSLMYLISLRPNIMFADKQRKSVSLVMEMLLEKELKLMPIQALVDGMKVIITESSVRRDLQLADEDGVNIPRSEEDRLKHIELMKICTILQKKVLDLEDELKRTKTALQTKIGGLESKVKKLEKKHMSRTHKLKRLYKVGLTARVISSSDDEALDKEDTSTQGRIDEIDVDEDIALVSTYNDELQDEGIKDVVSAAETMVTTAPTITAESTKTNVENKGKGKAKLIKEPEMPKKRKHQIKADKELAEKLQAEMQAEINEEDSLAREKAQQVEEVNLAWDYVHAKIEANYQLAQRLQAEEQERLTDVEKAKLLMNS
nr:hypothetical protein [Tanacetum cinerariifolium]